MNQQVVESESVNRPVIREISCTVCSHPERLAIDAILAAGSASRRTVANRFGLNESSIQRHKTAHLSKRVAKAVAKISEKTESQFRESLQFLMSEGRQYVVDAHSAIKMQKVTVKQPLLVNGMPAEVTALDDDGKPLYDSAGDPIKTPVMVNAEEYREFRDIGAMAPALNAAKSITEMLGTATGELSQGPQITGGVHLSVILPRAIETVANQALHEGHVVDVKAIPESTPDDGVE